MADTRRTRAYLLGTSFPDNTVGSISAQDMRDYVVSAMGSYANINNNAGDGTPTTQSVASATTVTLDWSTGSSGANGPDDTDGSSYGADADYSNDRIRIYDKGIYKVQVAISFKQDTGTNINWLYVIGTQADGGSIVENNYKVERYLEDSNDTASISINGLIDTTAHTNYTDLIIRLRHDNGSSRNILLQYAQMTCFRVG